MGTPNNNNDIMWDCFVDILRNDPSLETRHRIIKFSNNWVEDDHQEIHENFSHDNWTLVLCWLQKFARYGKKKVPIFGHHTLHPLRFFKFLWMKSNWFYPLRFLFILEALITTIWTRKDVEGIPHTSGVLLDYYVAYSYDMKWTLYLMTWLIEKGYFGSLEAVFKRYHGNPDHYNYKVYQTFKEQQ